MRTGWMLRMRLVGWLRVRFRGERQNIGLGSRTNAMEWLSWFFRYNVLEWAPGCVERCIIEKYAVQWGLLVLYELQIL